MKTEITITEEQQAAIESAYPETLVIAGPGSGKTHTLVERVYAIAATQANVPLQSIAIITFTNAAAGELQRRISERLGLGLGFVGYIGTLHGLMLRLLRTYSQRMGLPATLSVMDEEEAKDFAAGIKRDLQLKLSMSVLMEAVNLGPSAKFANREAGLFAKRYYGFMRERGTLSYDAILWFGHELLSTISVADSFPYQYLMVDEYQDTSELDHKIYKAFPAKNKWFVGDPDQAIYGFRGGNVSNIIGLALGVHSGSCENRGLFYLNGNFRSGQKICDAANGLISHNRNRVTKAMVAQTPMVDVVEISNFETPTQEKAWLWDQIQSLVQRYGPDYLREVAVLTRYNQTVTEYAAELAAGGIAVSRRDKADPGNDQKRDVLRFLSLMANPHDNWLAKWFIAKRHGSDTANRIELEAMQQYRSINRHYLGFETIRDVRKVPDILARHGFDNDAVAWVISEIDASPADIDLSELTVNLQLSQRQSQEESFGVHVGTIHGAKGREWDTVYLVAFEDEILPGPNPNAAKVEEQRRLSFVAVTRAKSRLYLSHCASRVPSYQKTPSPATPSRYLKEMF